MTLTRHVLQLVVMCTAVQVLSAAAVSAQSLAETFRQATDAAMAGDCDAARRGYRALFEAGVRDADVEHNQGVCFARQRELARAVFHFERALLYRPGDDDTRAVLAEAEEALARQRAEEEGEAELARDVHFVESTVKGFSEPGLSIAVVVSTMLFFLVLMLRRMSDAETPRLALGIAAPVIALVVLASGGGLAAKRGLFSDGRPGIILEDRVTLRAAPDPQSPATPRVARGGERVRVLDTYEDYVRVSVAGQTGWAPAAEVGQL